MSTTSKTFGGNRPKRHTIGPAGPREGSYTPHQEKSTQRNYSSRILELIDEGVLTSDWVAQTCIAFMSEDDVKEMVLNNDIQELF
jgi:hypothetical protein